MHKISSENSLFFSVVRASEYEKNRDFLLQLPFYIDIIAERDCTQICDEAEGCGIYVGFSVEYVRS